MSFLLETTITLQITAARFDLTYGKIGGGDTSLRVNITITKDASESCQTLINNTQRAIQHTRLTNFPHVLKSIAKVNGGQGRYYMYLRGKVVYCEWGRMVEYLLLGRNFISYL